MGNSKILCVVKGPVFAAKTQESGKVNVDRQEGTFSVNIENGGFSTNLDCETHKEHIKEHEEYLMDSIEPFVILSKYHRQCVYLFVTILESDQTYSSLIDIMVMGSLHSLLQQGIFLRDCFSSITVNIFSECPGDKIYLMFDCDKDEEEKSIGSVNIVLGNYLEKLSNISIRGRGILMDSVKIQQIVDFLVRNSRTSLYVQKESLSSLLL